MRVHSKVAYYRKKSQQKQLELDEKKKRCDHCDTIDKENAMLKHINKDILEANAELKDINCKPCSHKNWKQ